MKNKLLYQYLRNFYNEQAMIYDKLRKRSLILFEIFLPIISTLATSSLIFLRINNQLNFINIFFYSVSIICLSFSIFLFIIIIKPISFNKVNVDDCILECANLYNVDRNKKYIEKFDDSEKEKARISIDYAYFTNIYSIDIKCLVQLLNKKSKYFTWGCVFMGAAVITLLFCLVV